MLASDEIDHITTILDRWFGVDTLWLYGSQAEGTARADSDVDLAALFRRRPQGLEIFDARTELEEMLRRDVDLVDLDQAPRSSRCRSSSTGACWWTATLRGAMTRSAASSACTRT